MALTKQQMIQAVRDAAESVAVSVEPHNGALLSNLGDPAVGEGLVIDPATGVRTLRGRDWVTSEWLATIIQGVVDAIVASGGVFPLSDQDPHALGPVALPGIEGDASRHGHVHPDGLVNPSTPGNLISFADATGHPADSGTDPTDFDPAGAAATVQGNLDTHKADTGNPHATTAAQTGAPGLVAPSVTGNFVGFSDLVGHQQDSGSNAADFDAAGAAAAVQGNLDSHAAAATGVHGVGASTVESTSGAQAKVDTHAALNTSIHGVGASTVASVSDISTHAGLTTGVHGAGAGNVEVMLNKGVAGGYPSLSAGVLVVQDPANASATPGAGAIVKANGAGKVVAGWGGAALTLATLNASAKVVEDPANAQGAAAAGKIPIGGTGGNVAPGWLATGAASSGYVPTADGAGGTAWAAQSGGGAASALKTTGADVDVAAATPPSANQVLRAIDSTHAIWQTLAGGGDVTGPGSSVNANIAIFNGTTGKVIADGGATIASLQIGGAGGTLSSINTGTGNDQYTVFYLPFEHRLGGPSTEDRSFYRHRRYPGNPGGASPSDIQKKFGSYSAYFPGAPLLYEASDNMYLPGDFSVDLWIWFDSIPTPGTYRHIYYLTYNTSNCQQIYMGNTAGVYSLYYIYRAGGVELVSFSRTISAPSLSTWYHLAVTRSGNDYRIFWNGVQQGATETDSSAITYIRFASLQIGTCEGYGSHVGYMDEIRMSKGIARWTSDFTPPTAAYGGLQLSVADGSGNQYPLNDS